MKHNWQSKNEQCLTLLDGNIFLRTLHKIRRLLFCHIVVKIKHNNILQKILLLFSCNLSLVWLPTWSPNVDFDCASWWVQYLAFVSKHRFLPGNRSTFQITMLLSTDAVASHTSWGDHAMSNTSPACPCNVWLHFQCSMFTLALPPPNIDDPEIFNMY